MRRFLCLPIFGVALLMTGQPTKADSDASLLLTRAQQKDLELKKDTRLAVPDADAQARVEKSIRQTYPKEYTSDQADTRLQLATRLLEQAKTMADDPVGRFVKLREARDLAAGAGDWALALKAIDTLAGRYKVDLPTMKVSTFEVAARHAPMTDKNAQELVENALSLADETATADNYEAAARVIKIAAAIAGKAKSTPLAAAVQEREKNIAARRKEYEASQTAAEVLAKKPNDAAANLTLGRFLCVQKGEWEKGLPLLAKGGEDKLAALARKDLAATLNSYSQMTLGDEWWQLAESARDHSKGHLQRRAYDWYESSLLFLDRTNRAKVEARVQALQKQFPDLATSAKPFRVLEGIWTIKYANGATRVYLIEPSGRVFFNEQARVLEGQLSKKGEDLLLDFHDGKLERLKIPGEKLIVDHYNPAERYPARRDTIGEGVKCMSLSGNHSDLPRVAPFDSLEGLWVVKYSSKQERLYLFDAQGSALLVEGDRLYQALVTNKKGQLLLDFGLGSMERLRLADGKLLVDHFNPPTNYPDKIDLTGEGIRRDIVGK